MKVPVSWLNQYLERPLTPHEANQALEQAGIEVESVDAASNFDVKIIVGAIVAVDAHPQADRLKVATIDVKNTKVTIVTGAPNVTADSRGKKVAVAMVGAALPDGTRIKAAKLRGVESAGMLCSEQELGLGGDHSGIMFLSDAATLGQPIKELLSDIDVIETTTAANRWDLNGLRGLAIEAAAQTGQKTQSKPLKLPSVPGKAPLLVAINEHSSLVGRFMAAHLSLKAKQEAPDWLKDHLRAAGIRSISLVVDITNYVMLEYGQPMHAFDAAKLKLPLSVRKAESLETLVTLDGITRQLHQDDLVITDASGPISLAGIMGGRSTEVDAATTEIVLEVANFNASSIRKTAQRHGLRTDASARFERGLPVKVASEALARAITLLEEIADAKLIAITDHLPKKPGAVKITVRTERINRVLGLHLNAADISSQLEKLDFVVDVIKPEQMVVTVPWWRPDVRSEDDVAEEVIKLLGYDQLPATLPSWQPHAVNFDQTWFKRWKAKAVLRSSGLFEVVTYSFISARQIELLGRKPKRFLKLANPLSSEQAYVRTDMLPSLLAVAERNRMYSKNFGAYEFSKVYIPKGKGELPDEPLRLGVIVRAESSGYRQVKAVLDGLGRAFNVGVTVIPADVGEEAAYPGRAGYVQIGDEQVGWIGQLHPGLLAQLKLDGEAAYLELDWEAFKDAQPKQHQAIGRFPSTSRDISVVLPREVTWSELAATVDSHEVAFLSDYYGEELGDGKKSIAFQVTIRFDDRTPTEADADEAVADVLKLLRRHFNAEIRKS